MKTAPRAGAVGAPRSRAAALRRADLRARPRVLGRGARAHPRDGRGGAHRRHVHPPARSRPRVSPTRSWCSKADATSSPDPRPSSPGASGPTRSSGSRRRTRRARSRSAQRPGVLGVELDGEGPAVVRLDDIGRVPDLVDALVAAGATSHPRRAVHPDARGPLLRGPRGDPPGNETGSRSARRSPHRSAQLRSEPRDFWGPMVILGSVFFVFVPLVLLLAITHVGDIHAVQQVSQALDLLARKGAGRDPRRHRLGAHVVRARRLPVRSRRRRRAAHHRDRGRRDHDRRRAGARHRRVPRPLPRRARGHLPRQAHREPAARLRDDDRGLRPVLADRQPRGRPQGRRLVLPDDGVVGADDLGGAAVPRADARDRACASRRG